MTDDEKERIAIQVEHLPPDEAQAEYERLTGEANRRELKENQND